MKATTVLKNDHAKVKGLFREFDQTGERALKAKSRLFEKIKQELEVHTTIEEEIFYPAVRQAQTKRATELVGDAFQEHATVKRLLGEISKLTPGSGQFESKMSELIKDVREHVKEEEGELFPEAHRQLSSDELDDLGDRMEERKRTLTTSARRERSSGAQARV
jgi:iron-sulfur cluster repair protein YtfE (RIC family)